MEKSVDKITYYCKTLTNSVLAQSNNITEHDVLDT